MGTPIKHPVPDRVKPSFAILTSVHSGAQPWASVCGTRSGTRCYIAVPIWQQWASKGYCVC